MSMDSVKKGDNTLSPMRATDVNQTIDSANHDEREMFSPTSAAALALSTLHQHGADRNKRPEDLKGTRLFIQGETKEEKEQDEIEPPSRMVTQVPVAAPTFYVSGTPANAIPPVPAHYPPPPPGYQYAPDPRYSHPPAASPWQPTQYHQYTNVSVTASIPWASAGILSLFSLTFLFFKPSVKRSISRLLLRLVHRLLHPESAQT